MHEKANFKLETSQLERNSLIPPQTEAAVSIDDRDTSKKCSNHLEPGFTAAKLASVHH